MASLGRKLAPTTTAYARYAEGFQGVVVSTARRSRLPRRSPFRPEKVKALELGTKSVLADGRATLNLALFHNTITDLQQAVFTAKGSAASNIRNVGKASTQGLEVEFSARPTDDLRVQANYGYLDARFDTLMELGVRRPSNRAVVRAAPQPEPDGRSDPRACPVRHLGAMADYSFTGAHYLYPCQIEQTDPTQASRPTPACARQVC
ncbi:MAG: TonB-dependent receptor [Ideonella sp.]|nr:TonB-dependent receptor [Ideonella sp.]